jgi:2OG-Fe(II) oxygenase superfamily
LTELTTTAHCDGPYSEEKDGKVFRTHYTVHLYLNDSVAEAGESAGLVGGATSFLSYSEDEKMDVNPKAGRVLIFQHRGLYHSGDDVIRGTKYTMRTDIMYERMPSPA